MKTKILFVERKPSDKISIEKVFRQVAKNICKQKFNVSFQQLEFDNNSVGTIKNLLFFRKEKADIYHITGHAHYIALILPVSRTVLTIHDLGILHIRSGLRRFVLKKLLFDLPVKKLKYLTAVSEATKREIVFFTKCDEKKIRVIENPLQEHFSVKKKKQFNKQSPTILQIGTTANKNLINLIKALEGINCKLVIIGELEFHIKELLEEKKIDYQNKKNLNNEQIKEEYINADIVTFCSTFEGFGLPIIEAQAMLTPVVTSNISPLKEVAGDSAALTDPNDYKSIRSGILRIICDDEYRQKLTTDGIENIKRFQPEKIAILYENLYREIVDDINP
jgi:glycosyltransferase involved in cell wall biosynthesis